ncbi:MAG: ATP-binding cassette domain-containing protein [Ectothiorhodospira sp.]
MDRNPVTSPAPRTPDAPVPPLDTRGAVVRAHGLCKAYDGHTVVDHLDLEVPRGTCFGLLGPNGAGKTTTLRMLLGLTPPDAGRLEVLGEPVPDRARPLRARVGIVPQFDNLDPDFSVRENLMVYAAYFGLRGGLRRERVEALLRFAHLEHRAGAGIATLSGGMRRRLTLARALINRPELVVLDEPTTGLDPQARHHIWGSLRGLRRDGTTLILTTHYMEEAERLCDRVAIIDRGRVVVQGSPRDLIREHVEPHVVELSDGPDLTWLDRQDPHTLGARVHRTGDLALLYCTSPTRLLASLEAAGLRVLHRPGNLEDVFLRLTGRDLRD